VLGIILVGTAARLALACSLGLGVDESYMVAAGRTLRLGYFDHPPLSWWLSAGMAQLAGSEAACVVRLPFIALFALSTWLMFRFAAALFGARAGLWAAVALNLAPVFSVASGGWVLPDGPLDAALLAAALCLVRALPGGRSAWAWWVAAGGAAGSALLSKYSAGLVLAGAFGYLLTQPAHRRWLGRPQPYAAALVAAAVFAPVLVWNARHGWASFAFQGGRAGAEHLRPFGPLAVFAGEAMFLLPWLWLPLMIAFARGVHAGPAAWRTWLPCCLGVGPVLLFAVVGFWSRHVLFHWAAPGYLMLLPLLGAEMERLEAARPKLLRRVLAGTLALYAVALAVLVGEFRFALIPGAIDRLVPLARIELQARDWSPLRAALAERGLLTPGLLIGGMGWQDTGKLDIALGGDVPVICLNPDTRQYGFAPGMAEHQGADVLIASTRPVTTEALARQGVRFDALDDLAPVDVMPPGSGRAGQAGGSLFLALGHKLHAS
jgi:4-amino-4-deoxy-L-arabinose transferase-like glycosyltransferase